MTPDNMEKFLKWWNAQNKFGKARTVFFAGFAGLLFIMWVFKKTGLQDTFVGAGVSMLFTSIFYIALLVLAGIGGVSFIVSGKNIRDQVKGPNPDGVKVRNHRHAMQVD